MTRPEKARRTITITVVSAVLAVVSVCFIYASLAGTAVVAWQSRNDARDDLATLQTEQQCRAGAQADVFKAVALTLNGSADETDGIISIVVASSAQPPDLDAVHAEVARLASVQPAAKADRTALIAAVDKFSAAVGDEQHPGFCARPVG